MFRGNQFFCNDVVERFKAKRVERGLDDCWLWIGSKFSRTPYGQFKLAGDKNASAHRVAYMLFVGPIPEGMHVCHRCDVPLCVNPNHLFLGNQDINHADKAAKGRAKNQNWRPDYTVCIRGHSDAWSVTPNGTRYCKTCLKLRQQAIKTRTSLTPT